MEYIEREAAYRFAQDQLKKETGAYSKGWNNAMNVMKSAFHNNDAIPAADVRPVVTESPYMQAAIDSVIDERKRQINIWGCQYDNSMFEFMSILGEEYGELCEAVNETCFKNPKHRERGGLDNCYKEACHVAAVAVKLMERIEMMREEIT